MKLSKITVQNFRKFNLAAIDFGMDNLALLAGANNTGKTSLIHLLEVIFNNKGSIRDTDISLITRIKFIEEMIDYFRTKEILTNDIFKEELLSYLSNKDKLKYDIFVQFTISYEEDESIGLFANYLMDLDEDKREFFFEYRATTNLNHLNKKLAQEDETLFMLYQNLSGESEITPEKRYDFKTQLFSLIDHSLENSYYYCDSSFNVKNLIEFKEFRQLFNFYCIFADREIDDEKAKKKTITNSIIDLTNPLEDGSTWKEQFKKLHEVVLKELNNQRIRESLEEVTQKSLKSIKGMIDNVSDNEIEHIVTTMNLEERILLNLITNSVAVNYVYNNAEGKIHLAENSQGLGVSNLIYLTLEIEKYKHSHKSNLVNILVIEEPENHMHVQMQKVFTHYLQEVIMSKAHKEIQCLLTSHSTEIVKEINFDRIKVVRPHDNFSNFIVDLKKFIKENESERNFYETMFKLNFSNVVFADRAIIFEGDAERMFLEHVITRDSEFKNLAKKYIVYCQAGGAFAHKYKNLIEALKVKTCVFTDLDYEKKVGTVKEAQESITSNNTLKSFRFELGDNPIISDILLKQTVSRDNVYYEVFTQTKKDGYARTLEEAMLFSYINHSQCLDNVFKKYSRNFWKKLIGDSNLTIPTPNRNQDLREEPLTEISQDQYDQLSLFSISYLVEKMSNTKTDFMYSVIMHEDYDMFLPTYIKEGLTWLGK